MKPFRAWAVIVDDVVDSMHDEKVYADARFKLVRAAYKTAMKIEIVRGTFVPDKIKEKKC